MPAPTRQACAASSPTCRHTLPALALCQTAQLRNVDVIPLHKRHPLLPDAHTRSHTIPTPRLHATQCTTYSTICRLPSRTRPLPALSSCPPAHSCPVTDALFSRPPAHSRPAPGTSSSYLCRQKRPPYPGDTRPPAAAERQRAVGVHQRQFCQRVREPAAPLHCNPGPYAGNDARFLVRRPAHLPLTEAACYFGCTMSNNATFHFHTLCIFLAGGFAMPPNAHRETIHLKPCSCRPPRQCTSALRPRCTASLSYS